MKVILNYLHNVNRLYQTGNAREHSYRGDLQDLLNKIINNHEIIVTNEPARIRDVGAPDYSITKKDIPLGYIEAKDINKPLNSKEYKEQFNRYKNALDNLIITDYLDFWFYKNGQLIQKISIAKIENNNLIPYEKNFSTFIESIKDFTTFVSQTITSPSKLATLMVGGKLRAIRLLEDNNLNNRIIDIEGEAELEITNGLNKKDFKIKDNKVTLKLNDEVSIINIPLVAWEFYIGGYQPAQKRLKDRKGRTLSRADLKH